ncbi:hypothetical protein COCON_G00090420 [Conger conger]|uniref:Uncharacterized protein n=1 Tax=Conger conger TaxID=82655 RepID=A0A9Q1I0M2_CONCO|nr:hypothetical protein COCON_G00090420 [Conger conger]
MSVDALGNPMAEPAFSKRSTALRLVDLAGAHHHLHHHHHTPQSVTGFPAFSSHPHSMGHAHPGDITAEPRLGPSPFGPEHMGHSAALKISPAHHYPHHHHHHNHHMTGHSEVVSSQTEAFGPVQAAAVPYSMSHSAQVAILDTMVITPKLETMPSSLAFITNSLLTERQVAKP